MRQPALALLLALGTVALVPPDADGQVWKRLKERAKEKVQERIEQRTEEGIEKGLDTAENAIVCAITDLVCIEQARAEGKDIQMTDDDGNVVRMEQNASADLPRPGEGAWANYDFVPGDRVLFAEDFTRDRVGDFPRRITLVNGNWDVVEWQGERLLRNTGPRGAAVVIELPEQLPERFTIEFDAHFPHGNQQLLLATQRPPSRNSVRAGYEGNYLVIDGRGTGVTARRSELVTATSEARALNQALVPVRIMADGGYVKVYVGETRVANVPNAVLPRSNEIFLENSYFADEEHPMLFGNFRVAAGGADLYDRLATDGRVATQGIYFATGSARIEPQSTGTLSEIGRMLEEHPELAITIEGHTDDVGDEAANQALSERRAEAVRRYLVERHGIDASRLQAVGHGEAKPTASNETPEGRQQNRRVELVKR